MQGTLEVSVIAARELKNKDGLFGSNDPYAIIKCGNNKFKTEVKKKAGKECQWNQTFRLGVTDFFKELTLEVYDQDAMADDLIGKTTIPLQGILQSGSADAWYTIGKGSKSHGEIHLFMKFIQGNFPQGYDPNARTMEDNMKVAGGVAGGVLAAGALAFGAKMAYDHYNKKEGGENQQLNQNQGQQNYGGQQQQQHYGGGNQPGYANQGQGQGGYGGQQGGYGGQQGGYGGNQGHH